jgi:hypothetical protein
MQTMAYRGWPNCIRLANSRVELIATTDVGPRIVHLGLPGGDNIFGLMPDEAGKTGGDEWRIYGGHRLWHSPEARPRTYIPDNGPVTAELDGSTLRLLPPLEAETGIQKRLEITLMGDEPYVLVHHVLENRGLWPVELAPWALSVMGLGGVAILPQGAQPTAGNLLPNRLLALWPYSDLQDPRITWGRRYLLLRQDPQRTPPFKVGLNATEGWAAYYRANQLFVKRFAYMPGLSYPDFGCSLEAYTCDRFLELETLGPLTRLEPGEAVEHSEHWFLYDEVGPITTEDEADAIARPLAEESLQSMAF